MAKWRKRAQQSRKATTSAQSQVRGSRNTGTFAGGRSSLQTRAGSLRQERRMRWLDRLNRLNRLDYAQPQEPGMPLLDCSAANQSPSTATEGSRRWQRAIEAQWGPPTHPRSRRYFFRTQLLGETRSIPSLPLSRLLVIRCCQMEAPCSLSEGVPGRIRNSHFVPCTVTSCRYCTTREIASLLVRRFLRSWLRPK